MKDTNPTPEDRVELHAVAPVEKQTKLVGRLTLHPGQQVWELNMATKRIEVAQYEQGSADFAKAAKGSVGQVRHRLVIRENCLYCTAVTAQRADYKFMKMLGLNPVKLRKPNGKITVVPAAVVARALQQGP